MTPLAFAVAGKVSSRIFAKDTTRWGAETEPAILLDWVGTPEVSAPLGAQILALHAEFQSEGLSPALSCAARPVSRWLPRTMALIRKS